MNKHKELIARAENHLQFLTTISIFFPTVLYSFFKAVGEQDQSANNIFLKASTLITFYIISYLAFTTGGKNMSGKWLQWLDVLILIGVVSFVIPIIFATNIGATISTWMTYALVASLSLQTGMSVVIFIFIIFFSTIGRKLN